MRILRRRSVVRCQQLVELVTDYLDGSLDPVLRAAVEEHLAGCDACRGYVAQVERLLELTRESGPVNSPDELPVELVDALTERFRQRRSA